MPTGTASNDVFNGSTGDDTYVIGFGGGADIIYETGGNDTLQYGFSSSYLKTIGRGANTLDLVIDNGSAGKVSIANVYNNSSQVTGSVEAIKYSDRTLTVTIGSWASEVINGTAGDDLIVGSLGNDTLNGGTGNDIYVFSSTSGSNDNGDTVTDTSGNDTAYFDVDAASMTASMSGTNLVVGYAGSGSVTFTGNTVESFVNADGVARQMRVGGTSNDTLSATNTAGAMLFGDAGNDSLTGNIGTDLISGGAGSDTLVGGQGNDQLTGGTEADVYRFSIGDGNDIIVESDSNQTNIDIVEFTNVTSTQLRGFLKDPANTNDLLIQYGTSDQIIIKNYFASGSSEIEQIKFSDSVIWNRATIGAKLGILLGTSSAEVLNATTLLTKVEAGAGNDTINGSTGNDTLLGQEGNDLIIGGQGNDSLDGGLGADVYRFSVGDGVDVISDIDATTTNVDRIEFTNVTFSQLRGVHNSGHDLIVDYGISDRIVVKKYFETNTGIEQIKFSDGTIKTVAEIYTLANPSYVNKGSVISGSGSFVGTALNDVLKGSAGNDTLNGGAGADVLIGYGGTNTFFVDNKGDYIVDKDSNVSGSVININVDNYNLNTWYNRNSNVTVNYGAGVKVLPAFIQAMLDNTIPSSTTNQGNPMYFTYAFGSGLSATDQSNLELVMAEYSKATNVYFVKGDPSFAQFSFKAYDFGVDANGNPYGNTAITGTSGGRTSDVVDGYYISSGNDNGDTVGIKGIDFNTRQISSYAPGSKGFYAALHELGHFVGLLATDNFSGDAHFNTANRSYRTADGIVHSWDPTGLSDAWVNGVNSNPSRSVMLATDGEGQTSANVYASTLGAYDLAALHYQYGVSATARTGNDTYTFNDHYVWDGAGTDTFSAASQSLNVNIDLTPGSWIYAGTKLSDGVAKNLFDATQAFIGFGTYIENAIGGSGNDTLTGNLLGNNLNGGSGNDSISGGDGADILKGGLGTDTIDGGTGSDWADYRGTTLAVTVNLSTTTAQNTGAWGTDTIVNVENVFGGEGNDSLTGNALGNTIRGGLGNDIMDGLAGSDYVDYRDITTVGLTVDLSLTTAQVTGAGTDTILNFESIYSGGGNDKLTGNSLANQILAYAGNDTLSGGLGNDGLQGGVGNDTYLFQRGAGADSLTEADATAGNSDLLWFDTDVTSSQLWFQHSGNNLVVSVIGTSDKVTLNNWYTGTANQVETIKASDGKALLNTEVEALVSAMSVFTIPTAGTTTLPTSYQTSLNPVLAANWS